MIVTEANTIEQISLDATMSREGKGRVLREDAPPYGGRIAQ